jgi:hypothetical protein
LLLRLLPRIVQQCGASPDGVGLWLRWVQTYGSRQCPVTTTISVGDGVLDVPCWACRRILRQTTAPCCVGAAGTLVYLRALRVGTRGVLPAPYSAGRGAGELRQILVATRRHLPLAHRAQARPSAVLSGFGRTDTYTCRNATRLSLKAASLVTFLPQQESNRPPRRRKAGRSCQASPQLQTPQQTAHGCTHPSQTAKQKAQ